MLGSQEFKALVDTGNSITEAIAISENLHKKIGGKFKVMEFEETKTAKKGASLLKLGISKSLKLRIMGSPGKTWTVQPAVYRELADTVNIGIKFLETIGAVLKFKKGNVLIIGDDHIPMIRSMRSLSEKPARKETEENPDDEDLDSNDNDDNGYEDNNDHGKENDDTSMNDILDKDEEMDRHAKDLAFLDWFGPEFGPEKHKKCKELMDHVREKRHQQYHDLREQHMRKPGTKHWLVYAKAWMAVPPRTTRMVEVEFKGFPGTDPEQLNNKCVLFEKLKQGEEPVAVYIWKPQGMKIVVTNHEQDAKFVGAGQLLGKISLMESTLPDETTTSNGQPQPKGVMNPEVKGKPEDGPKSHGLKGNVERR